MKRRRKYKHADLTHADVGVSTDDVVDLQTVTTFRVNGEPVYQHRSSVGSLWSYNSIMTRRRVLHKLSWQLQYTWWSLWLLIYTPVIFYLFMRAGCIRTKEAVNA